MVMTVGEAFSEFQKCFPEANIGKSTFFSLRPDHVMLLADTPHDVCVCIYHFNFIELQRALHKEIPTIPNNHQELIDQLCCKPMNEMCMLGQCSKCPCDLSKFISSNTDLTKPTVWKQWEYDSARRPVLRQHSAACQNALENLTKQLPKFKKHCYAKKIQSDCFERRKKEMIDGEIVMQMDFAENYALISQDEIQSAHWSHSQVTLFTCCVWFPDNTCSSYVIVSNDRSHSKHAVYTYLKALIKEIRSTYKQLNKIYMFSDNCAQQFKNKYTLSNLCFFQTDFNLDIEWNFFSSSHGKGAMDGIGGTVKRNVFTAVKSRKVLIDDAKKFHHYVDQTFNTKIKSLYVDREEVEKNAPFLDKRWEKVLPIPEIQACHHFRPYDNNDLLISKTAVSLMTRVTVFGSEDENKLAVKRRLKYTDVYSASENSDSSESINYLQENADEDLKQKDYVVVDYEREYFPGQISEIKKEEKSFLYKVQCMTKSGPNWKWPVNLDEMFYTRQEIVKKIDSVSVIPVSSRGAFQVVDPLLVARWKTTE